LQEERAATNKMITNKNLFMVDLQMTDPYLFKSKTFDYQKLTLF
jgi:hypothetical protein